MRDHGTAKVSRTSTFQESISSYVFIASPSVSVPSKVNTRFVNFVVYSTFRGEPRRAGRKSPTLAGTGRARGFLRLRCRRHGIHAAATLLRTSDFTGPNGNDCWRSSLRQMSNISLREPIRFSANCLRPSHSRQFILNLASRLFALCDLVAAIRGEVSECCFRAGEQENERDIFRAGHGSPMRGRRTLYTSGTCIASNSVA